jgi:hypothetical protein
LNQEIINNQKLKSKAYDSIIRVKYTKIISMHGSVVKIIENFNSSLGLSQIAILIAQKYYLVNDYYWIAFVSFLSEVEFRAGKLRISRPFENFSH